MTLDTGDLINSIMQSLGRISFIKPEDIPAGVEALARAWRR